MSKILRIKAVQEKLGGISRSTLYAKTKYCRHKPSAFDPTFPRAIKIGVKAIGWYEAEVDAWLETRRVQ